MEREGRRDTGDAGEEGEREREGPRERESGRVGGERETEETSPVSSLSNGSLAGPVRVPRELRTEANRTPVQKE